MTDDSICLQPAGELARMIGAGEISSRELTELTLARIERLNPSINAVVTMDAERALEAAELADADGVGGGRGPLHGLPITIKDAIEVAGLRSTGGAKVLSDHVPTVDAPSVARLRAAGAVVIGKTNVPEWSGDIQTFNELFGKTSNPWDLTRTTGGSSGGPAAAVATGMSAFEVGTDIGGSIRIPSSYCGICGHKPSHGIVSQRGYLDCADATKGSVTSTDINVFGPLARSVSDLELLLDVLAGPDAEDEIGWRLQLPPARHRSLSEYRVGTWLDDPACEVESAAVALMRSAADALADAGARVEDARPPLDLAAVSQLFEQLLIPAISISFEGDMGVALGGQHREWLSRDRERAAMRRVWASWFGEYDVLLCPVMPMLPFPHDLDGSVADRHVVINGVSRPQAGTLSWTGLVGVSYLPSTVVPVGFAEGLPVGIQVVGPYLEDRTSLFVARALEAVTGGYTVPPTAH